MSMNLLVDMRDQDFVLFEALDCNRLTAIERFASQDRELWKDTIGLAADIARQQWEPVDGKADEEGASYDPGTCSVHVPAFCAEPYRKMTGAGFIGISEDPDNGGMGLPLVVSVACKEHFCAASAGLAFFTLLTGSAAGLIRRFGSGEQKARFLGNMLSGRWSGTMCLTEPGAGSDVGRISTKASRGADGTYLITGRKMFISAGEHDLTENIIHLVLARVEGAPSGTKGLSLFIVPKYLINDDGSPGRRNGVFCTGIEKKMGFHGSPTCSLAFGDDAPCTGYLLGREGQGMRIMFEMMNEERIFCGLQGLASSSYSYLHALAYAHERIQGPAVENLLDPAAPAVPIIRHPDVRRMLLWMKSHVEAMRMLTYFLALNLDLKDVLQGDEAREANAMTELLTPLCKAGNTDLVWQISAEAIQVFGGYGFCRDYPVERIARECKVLSIVEGTNGIQSMDILMRKILLNPGQYNYSVFRRKLSETVAQARNRIGDRYSDLLLEGAEGMDSLVALMQEKLMKNELHDLFSLAVPFQQALTMLTLAWMHLWSLTVSEPKMNVLLEQAQGSEQGRAAGDDPEAAFYRGKVLASRYFLTSVFPPYFGRVRAILSSGGEAAACDGAELGMRG